MAVRNYSLAHSAQLVYSELLCESAVHIGQTVPLSVVDYPAVHATHQAVVVRLVPCYISSWLHTYIHKTLLKMMTKRVTVHNKIHVRYNAIIAIERQMTM